MLIHERTVGDVTILDLEGRVLIGCDDSLYAAIADLVSRGRRKILLNMAGVSYWDPSCLGVLVRCFSKAKSGGAKLGILSPQAQLRGLLEEPLVAEGLRIIGFRIFDDEEAALRSFQEPEPA